MGDSELSIFFRPKGVAVIGASREPHKLGHGVVRNLKNVGYGGPVYPVNPYEDEILGYKVYRSIGEVPDPLDLAVVVVPAPAVVAQVRACGERGLRGVIVLTGGFRETGPEGEAREREIARIAADCGMRVLGPNCIGTVDMHTPLNTTFVMDAPHPGEIAFVSQSGAMAAVVIDWASGSGVGFSRIATLGNQVDITTADMLAEIERDTRTRVITGYVEGITDGQAFVQAATRASRSVPVLFIKAGRGTGSARAITSHTGALAGDLAAYQAAFRRSGVLWATSLQDMLDWARALAWQPLPRGDRVAVLTDAGGLGILAADALEEAGMRIAPLTDETKAFLRERVFAAASVSNPVDMLAGSGPATYAVCLDALLSDETVDVVLVAQARQDWCNPVSLAEVMGEVVNGPLARGKPIVSAIMGLPDEGEAARTFKRRHVPNYAFPEQAARALAAMWRRREWLNNLDEDSGPEAPLDMDRDAADAVIATTLEQYSRAPRAGAEWMSPDRVDDLLRAYGLSVPSGGLAHGVEEALELANRAGYPVALKLVASGVTHKTDIGGVVLNVRTPVELRERFTAMTSAVRERHIGLDVQGVYVQRMAQGMVELIVGVVRDPQFGPLLMAGTGGTHVELERDVAFELAPLTAKQANQLLNRTGAGKLLDGYRGAQHADRAAVVDAIQRLAQLAFHHPEIEEVEINPLLVGPEGGGAVAVDARLRVATAHGLAVAGA